MRVHIVDNHKGDEGLMVCGYFSCEYPLRTRKMYYDAFANQHWMSCPS